MDYFIEYNKINQYSLKALEMRQVLLKTFSMILQDKSLGVHALKYYCNPFKISGNDMPTVPFLIKFTYLTNDVNY